MNETSIVIEKERSDARSNRIHYVVDVVRQHEGGMSAEDMLICDTANIFDVTPMTMSRAEIELALKCHFGAAFNFPLQKPLVEMVAYISAELGWPDQPKH